MIDMNRNSILGPALAAAALLIATPSAASDCAKADLNRALVERFYTDVMIGRHADHAPAYLSADYIQHNPHVAPKRAGFMKDFGEGFRQAPPPDYKREILNVVAGGDLVVVYVRQTWTDPQGQPRHHLSFDQFRVENGAITEHWDADD